MGEHRVTVSPVPVWLDHEQLLGLPSVAWEREDLGQDMVSWTGATDEASAADLGARLRGLGFAGWPLSVQVDPPLSRASVRRARSEDARRRRDKTLGFSRAGTRLDEEGRFSLTAEPLALELGVRAARDLGATTVLDAGCGAGGNAIGFARAGLRVTAVEQSRDRLRLAIHNASVYGVGDRIEFVHGDATSAIGERRHDLVFVDPPWGGEEFDRACFDLLSLPLVDHALSSWRRYGALWIKAPASADLRQLRTRTGFESPWAFFGVGAGDRQRVKFIVLRFCVDASER